MIIALLENSGSGDGEAHLVASMLRDAGAEVHSFALTEADADQIRESGAERIVVAGGDGSIGLAAGLATELGLDLGVIPVGTANDFANALELPAEANDACKLAATGEEIRKLDLGRVNGRAFVNVASLGLAPAAAHNAEPVKNALGKFAYGVGALKAAASEDPVECTVVADDEKLFEGEAWQVIVGSVGAFGGGSGIESEPSDGMLDVVVIEAGPRAQLAQRAVGLRAGGVEDQTGVSSERACKITIEAPSGTEYNVDGEVVEVGRAEFTIESQAFGVVVG